MRERSAVSISIGILRIGSSENARASDVYYRKDRSRDYIRTRENGEYDITYQYDRAGNMKRAVDGDHVFTFGPDGRVAVASHKLAGQTETFQYDDRGQIIARSTSAGVYGSRQDSWDYDDRGALTRKLEVRGARQDHDEWQFIYDERGRLRETQRHAGISLRLRRQVLSPHRRNR